MTDLGEDHHASARLYSIVKTAKVNGLIPFDYILACLVVVNVN
jgi:hypothetical protein